MQGYGYMVRVMASVTNEKLPSRCSTGQVSQYPHVHILPFYRGYYSWDGDKRGGIEECL